MGADARYHLTVPTGRVDGPFLVYDMTGRCHVPLTTFGRALAAVGQSAAAKAYTYAVFPYFAFLDTDPVQRAAGRRWDSPPGEIHAVVRAYLSHHPEGPRCAGFTGCSMLSGRTTSPTPSPGWCSRCPP